VTGLFDGFEGYRIMADGDKDHALTSALVAVDANVLLNLYRYNSRTTEDLLTIFERFGDRLVVPYQAMREFHRNRLSAIGNPEQATNEARSNVAKSKASASRALDTWAKHVALEDAELQRLHGEIDSVFQSISDAVDSAAPDRVHASTPAVNDRVLKRLADMLEGKVLPRPPDEEWAELIAKGQRRVVAEQPPGYLDAAKGDKYPEGAAGDFLVYMQACEEAQRRHLDLVIVTGDDKEDWWWRKEQDMIGPRQEMTKEFFDLTGGRHLFLLRPSDLLERSGALDIEVSPGSAKDAGRTRVDIEPVGEWTPEAVDELFARLRGEGRRELEDVIREAARMGGSISRDAVYQLCGYDDDRMLRGFTRPTARITLELQEAGLLPDTVTPMLVSQYRDAGRLYSVRIPPEVVAIAWSGPAATETESELDFDVDGESVGKYHPLTQYLEMLEADSSAMTFEDVEDILGDALAPSARKHLPYWYSAQNSLGKAIAAAGFKARGVSLEREKVEFLRRAVT
jgi:hypothetical protein